MLWHIWLDWTLEMKLSLSKFILCRFIISSNCVHDFTDLLSGLLHILGQTSIHSSFNERNVQKNAGGDQFIPFMLPVASRVLSKPDPTSKIPCIAALINRSVSHEQLLSNQTLRWWDVTLTSNQDARTCIVSNLARQHNKTLFVTRR